MLSVSFALLGALAPLPGARAGEEALVADRLAREVSAFLEQLLGPGRSKVLVSAEGEDSQVETQTEVTTPVSEPVPSGSKAMPGYVTRTEKRTDYVQKDVERSLRRGAFKVKRLRVSVVLDSRLAEAQEAAVRKLVPDLLGLDGERGDELTVLRAPLLPAWRSFLLTAETLRILLLLGGAGVLVLLGGMLLHMTAVRAMRLFTAELAARRLPAAPLPAPGPAEKAGELLTPETALGGIPSLGEEAAPGAVPRLGRRFDFLTARDPRDVAELLAKESPQDQALLAAYLSETQPDAASRLFAALPPARQTALSEALVALDLADPERLAMLESRLRTAVEFGVKGPARLGTILSRLPPAERESVLGEIAERDRRAAEQVEAALFPFEGLLRLRDEDLRRLIIAVPYADWGTALRGSADELSQRVLGELPAGSRNLVAEAAATPQAREKVLEARSRILTVALAMADKGQIALPRPGAAADEQLI